MEDLTQEMIDTMSEDELYEHYISYLGHMGLRGLSSAMAEVPELEGLIRAQIAKVKVGAFSSMGFFQDALAMGEPEGVDWERYVGDDMSEVEAQLREKGGDMPAKMTSLTEEDGMLVANICTCGECDGYEEGDGPTDAARRIVETLEAQGLEVTPVETVEETLPDDGFSLEDLEGLFVDPVTGLEDDGFGCGIPGCPSCDPYWEEGFAVAPDLISEEGLFDLETTPPGEWPAREPEWPEDADDPVNHPYHYTFGEIEVLDAIEDWNLPYHLGNVVKYVVRAGHKGTDSYLQDLKKARFYLERYIELSR